MTFATTSAHCTAPTARAPLHGPTAAKRRGRQVASPPSACTASPILNGAPSPRRGFGLGIEPEQARNGPERHRTDTKGAPEWHRTAPYRIKTTSKTRSNTPTRPQTLNRAAPQIVMAVRHLTDLISRTGRGRADVFGQGRGGGGAGMVGQRQRQTRHRRDGQRPRRQPTARQPGRPAPPLPPRLDRHVPEAPVRHGRRRSAETAPSTRVSPSGG